MLLIEMFHINLPSNIFVSRWFSRTSTILFDRLEKIIHVKVFGLCRSQFTLSHLPFCREQTYKKTSSLSLLFPLSLSLVYIHSPLSLYLSFRQSMLFSAPINPMPPTRRSQKHIKALNTPTPLRKRTTRRSDTGADDL